MDVRAYIRVSTGKQDISVAAQRQQIAQWCERAGHTVVGWYVDEGVTGSSDIADRDGLGDALAALGKGEALVALKLDRVARDEIVAAMTQRLVERRGAKLLYVDGTGNGDGPAAALMRSMVAAFAAYELAMIRQRTRAALAEKRRRGELTGTAPLGTTAVESGRIDSKGKNVMVLKTNDVERAAVKRIFELRAEGHGTPSIARILNEEGVPARGKKWHRTSVVRVLKRGVPEGFAHQVGG
jgi:DNA invertase Pin-like site-specific DNA recombinase